MAELYPCKNVWTLLYFRLRVVRIFPRAGDFHARSRFARSTTLEEKWGTTRSLTVLLIHVQYASQAYWPDIEN